MVMAAACNTVPPREWLRYHQDGATNLTLVGDGNYTTTMFGAGVVVDLMRVQTRIEVRIENATSAMIDFRVGPDGAAPSAVVGEVLLRAVDGAPGVGAVDPLPYTCLQPLRVEPGCRGTFFLDAPLGREVVSGQSFTLILEARSQAGGVERRSLPLRAKNSGTMPTYGR